MDPGGLVLIIGLLISSNGSKGILVSYLMWLLTTVISVLALVLIL